MKTANLNLKILTFTSIIFLVFGCKKEVIDNSCPDSITWQNQTYQTVLIGDQCWMAENLNVGKMVDGDSSQLDNGIIEKYCYDNDSNNCLTYGGLYQWDELMQYSRLEGTKGICPDGWHIPSDNEWKELEIYLGMSQSEADKTDFRGTDQGYQLAGNSLLWNTEGYEMENYSGFCSSGFMALPGGWKYNFFNFLGNSGFWYSSTEVAYYAWYRAVDRSIPQVYRRYYFKSLAKSVRCLKDSTIN